VQAILEAEGVAPLRQFAERHAVDDRNLRKVVMRLARELQNPLQVCIAFGIDRQRDVDVRCAEGIFPVGRCIGTEVVQDFRARRHAFPEFDREAVERRLRNP
jgi:hypothetical protein